MTVALRSIYDGILGLSIHELAVFGRTLELPHSLTVGELVKRISTASPGVMVSLKVEPLLSMGDSPQKIQCIKQVRALTNLSLKEAKDLVERVQDTQMPEVLGTFATDRVETFFRAGTPVRGFRFLRSDNGFCW